MTTFDPAVRIAQGWRLSVKPKGETAIVLEALSPHVDRGQVRSTLTVMTGTDIRHRDTVNLTSERARSRLIAKLAQKGLTVDDAALVSLDQACRSWTPPATKGDGSPNISRKVIPHTLAQLETVFRRWLLITDPGLLPIIVGALLAHRFESDPVWLLVVAPPGATKTELIRSAFGAPRFFPLSELTPKTFASGLDVQGQGDFSLLARLQNKILLLKAFTPVLEMRREDRQAILAQLREIYDGRYDKVWGTGRELHWEGRLGFLGGVTSVIDRHQGAMSVLGERFVLFRPVMPNRRKLARWAPLVPAGRGRGRPPMPARHLPRWGAGRRPERRGHRGIRCAWTSPRSRPIPVASSRCRRLSCGRSH